MKRKQGRGWDNKFHQNKLKERKTKEMKRDGIEISVGNPEYEPIFVPSKKKKR